MIISTYLYWVQSQHGVMLWTLIMYMNNMSGRNCTTNGSKVIPQLLSNYFHWFLFLPAFSSLLWHSWRFCPGPWPLHCLHTALGIGPQAPWSLLSCLHKWHATICQLSTDAKLIIFSPSSVTADLISRSC